MDVEPLENLMEACVAFIRVQRELSTRLSDPAVSAPTLLAAMTAELDRLSAAVRDVQRLIQPPQGSVAGDPGE